MNIEPLKINNFNLFFPGILLAYLNGTVYTLSVDECDELSKYVSSLEARAEAAEKRVAELEAAQKEVDRALLHYLSRYPDLPILTYETQVEALCALMESVGLPGIAKPQPPKPEEVEG